MESFETVNRMIAQAAGDCAYKGSAWVSWGPVVDRNIAYRGIKVKFEPVAREGFEIRSFASLDEIRMKGGALHYRLGCMLKTLEDNKDNAAFFHSEQEEYDMSDGDGDISSFNDMSDGDRETSQHNSTMRAVEDTTSRIAAVSITSKPVYALLQYMNRCYVLEKDNSHHLIGGPRLDGESPITALSRHLKEQAAVQMKSRFNDFKTIRGNLIYLVEADREPAGKGSMASFANLDQLQAMDNNSDLVKADLHLYNRNIMDEQV